MEFDRFVITLFYVFAQLFHHDDLRDTIAYLLGSRSPDEIKAWRAQQELERNARYQQQKTGGVLGSLSQISATVTVTAGTGTGSGGLGLGSREASALSASGSVDSGSGSDVTYCGDCSTEAMPPVSKSSKPAKSFDKSAIVRKVSRIQFLLLLYFPPWCQ